MREGAARCFLRGCRFSTELSRILPRFPINSKCPNSPFFPDECVCVSDERIPLARRAIPSPLFSARPGSTTPPPPPLLVFCFFPFLSLPARCRGASARRAGDLSRSCARCKPRPVPAPGRTNKEEHGASLPPSPAAAAYPAAYSPVPGPSSPPRLRRVAGPRCSPVRPAPVLLGSQGKKYRRTGAEPRGHGPGGILRRSSDVVRPGSNQRRPGRRRAS